MWKQIITITILLLIYTFISYKLSNISFIKLKMKIIQTKIFFNNIILWYKKIYLNIKNKVKLTLKKINFYLKKKYYYLLDFL